MKRICFIGNSHIDQFKENINGGLYPNVKIDKIYSVGASIKGLVNGNSTLQLKEKILDYQNENSEAILLFFLGQVDIEFGYYYKCVKDGKKYDIHEYVSDLVYKYLLFIKKNIRNKCYIISINPTVIRDIKHNFNVCFRCNNGNAGFYSELNSYITFDNYKDSIFNDDYNIRYNNNKLFNTILKEKCIRQNISYIDLWNIIVENEKVKDIYFPTHIDHHLVVNTPIFTEHILSVIMNDS